jgi:TPR repeat protein
MFAETINSLGNWFSSLNRYAEAEECYEKAHKKDCIVALYNHGSMLTDQCLRYSRNKSKKDVQCLIEDIETEDKEDEDKLNSDRLRRAEKLLLSYIEIKPDDPDGYEYLASVYDQLHDYAKAREYRIISFKRGAFHIIDRILIFGKDHGDLAEIAYQMFIKIKNDKTFYINSKTGDVSTYKPSEIDCDSLSDNLTSTDESPINVWQKKELSDYHLKQISGRVLNSLGMSFVHGNNGVVKSSKKAHALFELAVEKDYPISYYNLGTDYLYGTGIDNDDYFANRGTYFERAVDLFQKGAEKGVPACFRELSRIYRGGSYSYSNSNSTYKIIEKDMEKSIEYLRLAAEKKDGYSCLEMIKHLQKTQGKTFSDHDKLYYDDDTSKKQMQYLFDYLHDYQGYDEPQNVQVPFNVLQYMKHKINYKMKKLKQKIIELEMKPPEEGGRLYKEAAQSFSENIKKL